jgi:uroporphyrinogen decarboxylase
LRSNSKKLTVSEDTCKDTTQAMTTAIPVCPDFERLRRTVRREPTDRVPLFELLVEFEIQSRFLGRPVTYENLAAQVEFWTKAGYDYIPLVAGMMRPGKVTEDSSISRTLRAALEKEGVDTSDDRSWNLEYTPFILDRRRFDRFPWAQAAAVDISQFHAVQPLLPEGMKVVAVSGKIFTLSWMLMGFENFAESLLADPELAADVVQRVAEIQLQALDQILALPHVAAVCAVDDMAYSQGPIISPSLLRKYILPWYRQVAARCHASGRLFFLHSDGDLTALMDDLIDLGLDALHPIDPTAMDIVEVKRRWGNRLCLFGNVDLELLRSGSPEEVRAKARDLLRLLAPGGGYGIGSGNSVPAWARLENYNAMREAALEFGRYSTFGP